MEVTNITKLKRLFNYTCPGQEITVDKLLAFGELVGDLDAEYISYFKGWFVSNPEGLTDVGLNDITRPVGITSENIISHKDTITSYLEMIAEGKELPYYTSKLEEYVEDYESKAKRIRTENNTRQLN